MTVDTTTTLAELRLQWDALATEDLTGLPVQALRASVKDLAEQLLVLSSPEHNAVIAAARLVASRFGHRNLGQITPEVVTLAEAIKAYDAQGGTDASP